MGSSLSGALREPVTKPMATEPSLGHSTKTTRLKCCWEVRARIAFSVTPYMALTMGTWFRTALFHSMIFRPGIVEDRQSDDVADGYERKEPETPEKSRGPPSTKRLHCIISAPDYDEDDNDSGL